MLKNKEIYCDRCNTLVKDACKDEAVGMTAGYYEVAWPSFWSNFAEPNEYFICDDCMFKDERYIEVYGKHGTH